jgi:hypothetical protein
MGRRAEQLASALGYDPGAMTSKDSSSAIARAKKDRRHAKKVKKTKQNPSPNSLQHTTAKIPDFDIAPNGSIIWK